MATLKEIAEAAGVSVGTVDRILHNRGRFSEKTAKKIHELVKELGYTPNLHARGLKKSVQHSFSIVIPSKEQDDGYWGLILEGIIRSHNELIPFGNNIFIYQYDRYSEKSCAAAFNKAFNDTSIGILTIPVRLVQIKKLLIEQEKPYLFVDTDIPQLKNKISYIGQNSYKSGLLSGKLMSMLVENRVNTKILIIDPYGEDEHLKNRIEGFIDYLADKIPSLETTIIKNNIDNKTNISVIETLKNPKSLPDGIFVANSMVYTIANYLSNKGKKYKKIPLIGYDLIPSSTELIQDETINFIITQQPSEQGYIGVKTLYDNLILKRKVDKEIIIPINIITKENLSTF